MTAARHLGACLALAVAALAASDTAAGVTRESTIQYGLENMVSGTVVRASVGGTEMTVVPIRTWKSESGHWCRRYLLTVSPPDAAPADREETRCRQDGVWMPVPE